MESARLAGSTIRTVEMAIVGIGVGTVFFNFAQVHLTPDIPYAISRNRALSHPQNCDDVQTHGQKNTDGDRIAPAPIATVMTVYAMSMYSRNSKLDDSGATMIAAITILVTRINETLTFVSMLPTLAAIIDRRIIRRARGHLGFVGMGL